MPSEKDILNQMRESAEQWEETPSAQAWDRLEEMLDAPEVPAQAPAGKILNLRNGLSGLIIFLIVGVCVWSFWPDNVAEVPAGKPELTVQSSTSTGQKKPAENTLATTENVNDVASSRVNSTPVQVENVAKMDPNLLSENTLSPRFMADLAQNSSPQPGIDSTFAPPTTHEARHEVAMSNTFFANNNWGNNVAPLLYNSQNFVSYEPGPDYNWNPEKSRTINDFNYLLGSWRRMGPSGDAYEQWQKTDRFTLDGQGYFIVNGDTVVTEHMQIRQIEDNLYYIVAIDSSRKPHKFKLRSYGPNGAIFENPELDFPREVIIHPGEDGKIETILQNPGNAQPIPPEQEQYLELNTGSVLKKSRVVKNLQRQD